MILNPRNHLWQYKLSKQYSIKVVKKLTNTLAFQFQDYSFVKTFLISKKQVYFNKQSIESNHNHAYKNP